MLRTFTRMALGVASVPIRSEARTSSRPARRRVPVQVESRRAQPSLAPAPMVVGQTMLAPWGEVPTLERIAVVTTQPFPAEWWRRPRAEPVPDTPFIRGHEQVAGVGIVAARRAPMDTDLAPVVRHARIGDPGDSRRGHRHGRFARLCLVIAGALISFIVVDAASGHGRR